MTFTTSATCPRFFYMWFTWLLTSFFKLAMSHLNFSFKLITRSMMAIASSVEITGLTPFEAPAFLTSSLFLRSPSSYTILESPRIFLPGFRGGASGFSRPTTAIFSWAYHLAALCQLPRNLDGRDLKLSPQVFSLFLILSGALVSHQYSGSQPRRLPVVSDYHL